MRDVIPGVWEHGGYAGADRNGAFAVKNKQFG
jgi:hypothetical protein